MIKIKDLDKQDFKFIREEIYEDWQYLTPQAIERGANTLMFSSYKFKKELKNLCKEILIALKIIKGSKFFWEKELPKKELIDDLAKGIHVHINSMLICSVCKGEFCHCPTGTKRKWIEKNNH